MGVAGSRGVRKKRPLRALAKVGVEIGKEVCERLGELESGECARGGWGLGEVELGVLERTPAWVIAKPQGV